MTRLTCGWGGNGTSRNESSSQSEEGGTHVDFRKGLNEVGEVLVLVWRGENLS